MCKYAQKLRFCCDFGNTCKNNDFCCELANRCPMKELKEFYHPALVFFRPSYCDMLCLLQFLYLSGWIIPGLTAYSHWLQFCWLLLYSFPAQQGGFEFNEPNASSSMLPGQDDLHTTSHCLCFSSPWSPPLLVSSTPTRLSPPLP